jgi:hypothetical protein
MAGLRIEIDVRDKDNVPVKQTMQVYRVPENEKVTFVNLDRDQDMVVRPKPVDNIAPFCEKNDASKAKPVINVPKNKKVTVSVCENYDGNEIRYTAKIGSAGDEDPIVIIEKPKSLALSLDVVYATVLGLAVGAILAVAVMRLTARKATIRRNGAMH